MWSKYEIGEEVWIATHNSVEVSTTCPDCQGDKYLTVIFKDYTTCTIPCRECEKGYLGPLGRLYFNQYQPTVEQKVIIGIDVSRDKTEYKLATKSGSRYNIVEEENVFLSKKEAEVRAKEMVKERNKREEDRIKEKVKDYKSWAWNVNYHRSEIRRMKKSIEYHQSQLDYAKTKVKKEL